MCLNLFSPGTTISGLLFLGEQRMSSIAPKSKKPVNAPSLKLRLQFSEEPTP